MLPAVTVSRELSHPSILRCERGLSTLEYTVVFILLLVGVLAVWMKLGRSLETQVGTGEQTFARALSAAQAPGVSACVRAIRWTSLKPVSPRRCAVRRGVRSFRPSALIPAERAQSVTRTDGARSLTKLTRVCIRPLTAASARHN